MDTQEKLSTEFVQHRIRRDWRGDIEVLRTVRRRKLTVFGKRQVLVQIGCRSQIACEQARISLAAYVQNNASDWEAPHLAEGGDSDHPFKLWLIQPTPPSE